ncbi:MAG: ABC-F family ATP-binding cassette domain-containing protein [Fimbriimonadaceae bacterium]
MILQATGLAKGYGADPVLLDATFRIDAGEKVALVGRNGTGKTTLLKILVGDEDPDAGKVAWSKGVRFGYLRQHVLLGEDQTVLEAASEARSHLLGLQQRLEELEARIEAEPTEDELAEYALLHDHFVDQGGYAAERDIRTVLLRMGFAEPDFEKPVSALSGGERTRLMLARLMLEEPDLLILDEPTNHLDLDATEWLEGWIRGYGGAVLLVSHDRTFLQNVADRYLEVREGRVKSYPGPFDQYLRVRREEDEAQAAQAKKQAEQIAKLDEYVRRFMNSQRTAQARGRLKLMQRLKSQAIVAPSREKGMAGGFAKAKRSGDLVVETRNLGLSFGNRTLFRQFDWTVRWGERWGIIGANGAGKSSLVHLILGDLEADEGSVRIGSNVVSGWFQQDAEDLDSELTPLETLVELCRLDPPEARALLGRFLISDDDALRPVKTLSGGERNKLQLAALTAMNPNLLVLDEPTNHLDMNSREALCEVLKAYTGTLLLVSHDRWLLSEVVDHVLDLRREGPVVFPGGYADYRRARAAAEAAPTAPPKSRPSEAGGRHPFLLEMEARVPSAPTKMAGRLGGPPSPKKAGGAGGRTTPKERPVGAMPGVTFRDAEPELSPRELSKEIARVEKALAQAESDVDRAERALAELEQVIASPPADADFYALGVEHEARKAAVDQATEHWAELADLLDRLRAKQGGR